MAYPFGPALPFGDFRQQLITRFDCSWELLPEGNGAGPEYCLVRRKAGATRVAWVGDIADEQVIPVWTQDSILNRLGLTYFDFSAQ